jgi:hypothetical protein
VLPHRYVGAKKRKLRHLGASPEVGVAALFALNKKNKKGVN